MPAALTFDGIAVTGLGVLGPAGAGAERLGRALAEGRAPGSPADVSELAAWVPPAAARRMSPPSRFAVAAARMAGGPPGDGTAVVLATAYGPSSYTERFYRQVLDEGPETASPSLFTETVANAPAAQVAIACSARGPNLTVTQREAGPLLAVAAAAAEIAGGRADAALAGAVEEITPLLLGALGRFGALADGAPRPLDRRRDGLLAAEGATVLALERGGRRPPLAWVRAALRAFDPTATRAGWGRGAEGLAETLRALLDLGAIDVVVSGASGSRAGDRLEAEVLRRAWGDRPLPPVVAPKAVTGEYGGGFLAAAVLAVTGAPLAAPDDFELDPELGIAPSALATPPRRVLVSTLASGGAAAWLVLEAP